MLHTIACTLTIYFHFLGSYGRHNLPLFGHFCCRLAVQPTCMMQDVYSGSLYVPQSFIDSNINVTTVVCIDGENWVKCLARLVGFKLKLWTSKRNFAINKQPDASISINKVRTIFYSTY